MKIKTEGYYATKDCGYAIAYSDDINKCLVRACKAMVGDNFEGWGIYDAESCEEECGEIVPNANATPIYIFRDGVWMANPYYNY